MEEPVMGPPVQTLGPVAPNATASIALRPWQVSIGGSEAVVRPPAFRQVNRPHLSAGGF